MYLQVQLLNGFKKPLLYKIPKHITPKPSIGTIVKVPLKNMILPALVINLYQNRPDKLAFKIKEILGIEKIPNDISYHTFLQKISKFYFLNPIHFYHRIQNFLQESERKNSKLKHNYIPNSNQKKIQLTPEQNLAVQHVQKYIYKPEYSPTLLHGVTGSGKTEVYKNLIIQCIKKNKSIVWLLPEVSLSLQFQHLLQTQLPNVEIFGFHSASKPSEKRAAWKSLCEGKPILLLGVHLPVLLPISNLGLIIIDEEHETGFQEKKHPKINSKECALWRAYIYKIPILLGSATPSITSLVNIKKNNWKLFELKNRFSGKFPKIQKVLLTDKSKKRRSSFWISQELEQAIKDRLKKKEQIIIYLNRRGYSFFIQCKQCGFIFECPHCSVSLTPHSSIKSNIQEHIINLRCHYCNYHKPLPLFCPTCKAPEKELLKKGVGTQQIVLILKKMFPTASIERADLDSTVKKRTWQQTVTAFEQGNIDILVGTKTITKGYHFPKVTLVGILWADLTLHFPHYNASETTLQQLIQVAGRAGRDSDDSLVILQIMQNHQIFDYVNERDYLKFTHQEMAIRKEINYPPFCRLVHLELRHKKTSIVEEDAELLIDELQIILDKKQLQATILGPAHPIVSKIQNIEMRHVFIKSPSFKHILVLLNTANLTKFKSKIFIVSSQ